MERKFEVGQAYKILLPRKNQKKTVYFQKITDIWGENNKGEIVVKFQAYEFSQYPEGHGWTYKLQDRDIIEIEVAKPKKAAKPKAPKTCQRCGGSGILEHMRHVRNGECFECGGAGKKL